METIIKCSISAILGTMICLVIKKQNPEISLALSLILVISILTAALSASSVFSQLLECANSILGSSSDMIKPLLKCLGVGFVSKLASDLCRDASQISLASAMELCGILSASAIAMPVVIKTLTMIGTIV